MHYSMKHETVSIIGQTLKTWPPKSFRSSSSEKIILSIRKPIRTYGTRGGRDRKFPILS